MILRRVYAHGHRLVQTILTGSTGSTGTGPTGDTTGKDAIQNTLFVFVFFSVSSFDCDFEAGLCSWTQTSTDNFDWSRNSGSTSSTGTGPTGDHTTGKDPI